MDQGGSVQSLTVDLATLDLDLRNPRIDPASHQTQAISEILQAERIGERIGEKIYSLAKSICELASVDPSERLIVIANPQSPGRYIVLDGNRRVTALKLLTETTLLDRDDIGMSASLNRRMHALRNEYPVDEISTRLDVALADSREEARPFIRLKHTVGLDGAGRSSWSPMQQARFDDNGTYKLLTRLRVDGLLNSQTLDQLDSSEFAVSTFERAAGSSEFTNRFGGRIASDAYDEGSNPARALFGWARVANDTASGQITSRTIQLTEDVATYLQPVLRDFKNTTDIENNDNEECEGGDATSEPVAPTPRPGVQAITPNTPTPQATPIPGAVAPTQTAVSPSPATTTVRPRSPRVRHYLIDRRNALPVNQQKCRRIHDELMGKVKVSDAPYACAFLVRSFLELTAHTYLNQFGLRITSNFTNNITALAQDLMSQPRMSDEPADRVVIGRALLSEAGAYEGLSDATHNVHVNLSPDHVRATWDSIEAGLRLAWRRISRGGGQQPQHPAQ
ncbi:hypothetical protein XcfCFBP6990P_23615 [Xanthomonas citri pv. phaseoli var. fuscans]|uniref:ParB/Sulfiredoxin domain-containing protein n=1 Tax=Xanthomonas campestris pv. phaseoli TaxID=317013 RepID=A0A7Z7IZM5_XANCH|nr:MULTISPECIES: hypothetical protein [Xanthomonas]QTD87949.1 hypothetical protein XcfCFBP6988P_23670 [Xanthomonas citri pv. phaseoli var. fuscans]QTF14036.1 hypothetical protein XcfCFBP6989P_23580 [Xanthomonas citri pv. phaseoli var. fuscans]QTF76232.1 hypothetical protein XcfCFBP6990P_23615 [Xanthomonas citri pv. phaseoli var. fuscans]UZB09663.1 hypothetical protein OM953_08565 [Xanthomonas citri pv. fuscans]SON97026.1 hypothetical protein XFF6990_400046 [Xanthomonas citri pv. fuscans]